jgi:hypothetical protein
MKSPVVIRKLRLSLRASPIPSPCVKTLFTPTFPQAPSGANVTRPSTGPVSSAGARFLNGERALPFAVRCQACEERCEEEQGHARHLAHQRGRFFLFSDVAS